MTTNQTIDGVPREQMISFPRELSDELAELIAEKARVCGGGADEIWEAICDQFGTQAQPHEPVAWLNVATGHVTTSAVVVMGDDEKEQVQSLYAEQPAPVAVVHTMKSVMEANCRIIGAPVLTSNHCAALAAALNAGEAK